jgi:Uma2 family endonuclease
VAQPPHSDANIADEPPIVVRTGMTADQYFGMPASSQPQNLIDGLLYISPRPGEEHDALVEVLWRALREYSRVHGGHVIGLRFDCWLDDSNILQPDSAYVTPERAHLAGRYMHGPPDLVVEVLSPGTRAFDNEAKFAAYGTHGVREAWFADPIAETVTVVNGDGRGWQSERTVPFGEAIPSQIVDIGAGDLTRAAME